MAVIKFEKPKRRKSFTAPLVAGGLVAGVAIGVMAPDYIVQAATGIAQSTAGFVSDKTAAFGLNPSCKIKGNVSINTGERIYHVPGQEFYSRTKISPQYGERWFCSEQEARAAGWRKARR